MRVRRSDWTSPSSRPESGAAASRPRSSSTRRLLTRRAGSRTLRAWNEDPAGGVESVTHVARPAVPTAASLARAGRCGTPALVVTSIHTNLEVRADIAEALHDLRNDALVRDDEKVLFRDLHGRDRQHHLDEGL